MAVAGIVLLVGGALLALVNWSALMASARQKKHISMVGPFGGLAMIAGSALLGIDGVRARCAKPLGPSASSRALALRSSLAHRASPARPARALTPGA